MRARAAGQRGQVPAGIQARLDEAYGRVMDDELWLLGLHIQPYAQAHGFGAHEPDRP